MISVQRKTDGTPANDLLRSLAPEDLDILRSHLEEIVGRAGQALYHPGDTVDNVYFPCGPTLVSFAVEAGDDREIEVLLIGREGAAGGAVSRGLLPAYSRIKVKMAGPLVRLPARKLHEARQESHGLRQLLTKYADCFVAQSFQSTACNAAHSIEQRAAKWLIELVEHTGELFVPLTHEQFAGILGVGRSYASRVLQDFKAADILETARGSITVRNLEALHRRSCSCNRWVKKHFAEVFAGAKR
ncbi:Crp/Fnr family transcriptional regulator [Bradyrhizobium manausense]|uniref:Crp/Fnr family transcriptional regulator n=1 Tax=Bradyrhizobium manausense TaxID=989370 RepID=UPI0009F95DE7|nr:Crp/Fnr family transcriptional regulator [Bradyrhizobium manausense]